MMKTIMMKTMMIHVDRQNKIHIQYTAKEQQI